MLTENLAQSLERLSRHWESQRSARINEGKPRFTSHPFTIALSREAGTLGTSIARETGKRLGWIVYDHELVERIAQDMGVRTSLLNSVDERRMSWIFEAFAASMPARVKGKWDSLVSESAYSHHLIKTVLALGEHGECVIVGRGASFILPADTTLRVRLIGENKERIAALTRKLRISEPEAARQVRNLDRERNDFIQDHFLKDATDPSNYDLILNAPRLSADQIAEVIVETLRRFQAHAIEKNTLAASN